MVVVVIASEVAYSGILLCHLVLSAAAVLAAIQPPSVAVFGNAYLLQGLKAIINLAVRNESNKSHLGENGAYDGAWPNDVKSS